MKRTRIASIISAAALVAASGAASALATEPISALESQVDHERPDVDAPQIGDSINEAELADLRTVANQRGISIQAAIDRYAWNDNFALAVARIRQASPGAFAGAAIVDADHAWVAFAGRAPETARDIIDSFGSDHNGISVDLRTHLGFTEVELERAIASVHFSVLETRDVRDASTSYDYETGLITTSVVLESAAPDSVLGDLEVVATQALINATRADILDNITAAVVRSDSQVIAIDDSNSEHLGGEDITGCTSGFGTRASSHTSGTRGISTAGHCDDAQTDDGSSLTYKGGHEGTHGDFQWHTGPDTGRDDFYSGSSSSTEVNRRDVSAVGLPVVGQSLCRNGVTSHKDCQEVRKINVCAGGECNLVQMEADLSAGGDSGGSVFWGNTAYGLHKGEMFDPWPFDRDIFSRADRIDNALGIFIATS